LALMSSSNPHRFKLLGRLFTGPSPLVRCARWCWLLVLVQSRGQSLEESLKGRSRRAPSSSNAKGLKLHKRAIGGTGASQDPSQGERKTTRRPAAPRRNKPSYCGQTDERLC